MRSKRLTKEKGKEKVGLVWVLEKIRSGLNPSQISAKYQIPKQNISYFVGKLKKEGCIKRVGYGTWEYMKPLKQVKELTNRQSNRSIFTSKQIRGHAFIWKIRFGREYDWEKLAKNYKKKKLNFQTMQHNKVVRTIFNNRKIWLINKGMVIYESLDFMGRSSFSVKGTAVFEMDKLIKDFFSEMGLKFEKYMFTTSREHYGMVKNELARQYNEKKEKMIIASDDGDVWLWIDDSKGLGELETNEVTNSRRVQKFWNNHKKNKFEVDADYVKNNFNESAKQIKENAEHLAYHAENMRSHVGATRDLSRAASVLNENIEKQNKLFERIAKALEHG